MTEPDSNHVRQCLADAEFVVLQEIFPSETSAYADVLFSGASFAEKHGSFTNTERRVQPVRQAISPIGDCLPDWKITTQLAKGMLTYSERRPSGKWAAWGYESADDVLREVNALTPSYRGITPERLESGERLQWPVPQHDHPGTPILHVGKFSSGRGRFHVVEHLPPAELPDDDYPLLLTTGRVLYHWHGGELTRRAAGLAAICPEPILELSPEDARRRSISPGDWVSVTSRRGELRARACVTTRVSEGVVFANFHFPGLGNANNLTNNRVDPIAKIPEYKVCAVRIEPLTTAIS
jgi:formate dehydrogenase major subunit/formate dehydrogenase alpha subunit